MNFLTKYFDKKEDKLEIAFDNLVQKIHNDSLKLPFAEVNDSYKYITDIETNRIVYMDEGLKKLVDEDNPIGKQCFTVLQDAPAPCVVCKNNVLKENEVVQWVYHNKSLNKLFLIRDFLRIVDGRKLHYQMALDITNQLKEIVKSYGR